MLVASAWSLCLAGGWFAGRAWFPLRRPAANRAGESGGPGGAQPPWSKFETLIRDAARRTGLDAGLIRAVIVVESGGDPRARSRSGAAGLMQLMPGTAAEVARQLGREAPRAADLEDPALNILLGTEFLRRLQSEFLGDPAMVLAAYNAGKGNVYGWGAAHPESSARRLVERHGFPETASYVARVLRLAASGGYTAGATAGP